MHINVHKLALKAKKGIGISGITRPGRTEACALPLIFQALPSPAQQESHDSIMN